MIKMKDLNGAEKEAIGYNKSEQNLQNSSISKTQKNNDKGGIDVGGILAIIGAVSVLTIGSVVVVKKRLNKKVKK
jgi:hypothetical protein